MNLDVNGNIVQQDGDGGDTAQRTGFLETGLKLRDYFGISNLAFYKSTPWRFDKQWPTLFINDQLVRNPIKYNDPKDTSRDQTTPMISAFALNRMLLQVKFIIPTGFLHLKYPNADIASPQDMNHIDRALGLSPSWFGDVWGYGAVMLRCYQASKDLGDVGDDLNCLLTVAFAFVVSPTNQSRRNLKYYLEHRPESFGNVNLHETDNVVGALAWYNRLDAGGNPELTEVWRPIVAKLRTMVKVCG